MGGLADRFFLPGAARRSARAATARNSRSALNHHRLLPASTPVIAVSHGPAQGELGFSSSGLAGGLAGTALVDRFSTLRDAEASSGAPPAGMIDAPCRLTPPPGRVNAIPPERVLASASSADELNPGGRTVGMARFAMTGSWLTVEARAGLFFSSTCPSENSKLPLNRCNPSVQCRGDRKSVV